MDCMPAVKVPMMWCFVISGEPEVTLLLLLLLLLKIYCGDSKLCTSDTEAVYA